MAQAKLTPASKTPRKVTKNAVTPKKINPITKARPNASILKYFKKAADETLFIGEGKDGAAAGDVEDEQQQQEEEEEEDIYGAESPAATSAAAATAGKRQSDEVEGSSSVNKKRRKLISPAASPSEIKSKSRENKPGLKSELSLAMGEEEEESPTKSASEKRQPVVVRRKTANPFLDDSSSEEDDDDDEKEDKENERPRVRTDTLLQQNVEDSVSDSKLTSEENKRIPPNKSSGNGVEEAVVAAPLLRHETSGAVDTKPIGELQPEIINDDNGDNNEDFPDDDFGEQEEYDEDFTGEEFEVMHAMEEQARLEAEEYLDDSGRGRVGEEEEEENKCPICNGSLNGLTESTATAHVNSCLDGNPTPLPTVINGKEKDDEKEVEVEVGLEVCKGFASKAAVARPGQANPFSLVEGSSTGTGGSSSAFAKLMSGHAEDSAWASAASAEQASRGMPAYKRTCPFYKIMPGFSICVDAFRYGAVEGCKAYFLSHFHSDHYIGLSATWTYGPIYCSKVTGSLVKSQLKTAAKFVVELEFEKTVPVPGIPGVTVTMIPANHCPGSSLFLFEKATGGKTQRILHCGDFRACPAHVEHPQLRPETVDAITGKTRQQKIDVCYLDTTYLNPRYSFPPQNDVIRSCAEVCAMLNKGLVANDSSEWDSLLHRREGGAPRGTANVSKFFATPSSDTPGSGPPSAVPDAFTVINPSIQRNRLLVVCGTYSIGKERICVAIAQALRTKIFANPAKIRMCKQLDDPELASLMTSDPREAQVHMQMLMELRAETLAEYLEAHRSNGFTRVIGFRPSGWSYRPSDGKKNAPANLAPGSLPTAQILHGSGWKTSFNVRDLVPQRGSTREAVCFGVPYSEHSSFRELAVFLMALRIEKVIPTVNVGSEASRKRMKGWTDRWLAERRKWGLVRVLDKGGGGGKKEEGRRDELWEGKVGGKGGGVRW